MYLTVPENNKVALSLVFPALLVTSTYLCTNRNVRESRLVSVGKKKSLEKGMSGNCTSVHYYLI